jgi:ferric-dicitrate binding protein FerR (iron transport regulator)
MTSRDDEKTRITREAVQWLHRLQADPAQETADEFNEWIGASPAHLKAFLLQAEIEEAIRRGQGRRVG